MRSALMRVRWKRHAWFGARASSDRDLIGGGFSDVTFSMSSLVRLLDAARAARTTRRNKSDNPSEKEYGNDRKQDCDHSGFSWIECSIPELIDHIHADPEQQDARNRYEAFAQPASLLCRVAMRRPEK